MAINDLDQSLFAQEMKGVQPLKAKQRTFVDRLIASSDPGMQYRREKAEFSEQEQSSVLSLVLKRNLSVDQWLSYKREGIQTAVFKNLRLGKYPIETTLNLFNKSPVQARDDLLIFIKDCQAANIRSVLMRFGRSKNGVVIKSYLSQWLPMLEEVQAFHTAQMHHGGNGCVYVMLRKSEQQRLQNRERHLAKQGS